MKAAYAFACIAALLCASGIAGEKKAEGAAVAKPSTDAEKVQYSIGYMQGKGMERQEKKIDIEAMKKGMQDAVGAGQDKLSYSLGMVIADGMKEQGMELNPSMFAAGMGAAASGDKPVLTQEEMEETLKTFQTEMRLKMQKKMKETQAVEGKKNIEAGKTFLEENKKKDGVKTTPSGLQYKVVKEGKGAIPTKTDKVKVNYKGTLTDGTKFDSSYDRGEPAEFEVTGVIPGWTEALLLMPVGSKWELVIPSDLAYGEKGAGAQIGPNSVLCFEVELIEIVKGEGGKAAEPKTLELPGK